MPDHGHDLLFGTFLTPSADRPELVVERALLTERLGLDLVTVQDHPYQARFLDTWTLLSVIAARTARVRVAPNVANLPLRPPAVLARSVASLDLLTGGRVELGLGAGAFRDPVVAMGGPRLSASEGVDALEEGIAVIRAIWDADGPAVRVDGRHHRVMGAHPGPAPAHDVGIWLGAYKPRMLRLTGRLADGWLPSSPYAAPDVLAGLNAVIDDAALEAGRRPSDVRRLYNISGTFTGNGTEFLAGPASTWVEQLAELAVTEGISGFILMGDDPELVRRFAGDVVPGVRELVAAERARPAAATGPAGGSASPASVATLPAPAGPAAEAARAVTTGEVAGIRVTPDDGTRLSDERVWDDATRPSGPPPDPSREYSSREQAAGRHLVDVHDHLRQELTQLRDLVEQVTAGALDPGAARSHIQTMTMRQNNWTVGAYCESYCRLVTGHHSLEDQSVFPHLRRREPALAPVLDRLEAEHLAVHDVLERFDRALVAFVTAPEGAAGLRAALDLVTDTLLSHLSYEERELVEPLARVGFF